MSTINNEMGSTVNCDAVVIGAGFSGMSAIYRLRKIGLNVKCFESGSDFGGVWFWNRYPGARVDSEWPFYQLNIPEVFRDWSFSSRFSDHYEIREYMAHIDKTLDLRKDVEFESEVNSCIWNVETARWTVKTANGRMATCKYLVLCTGLLHRKYCPEFSGSSNFKGIIHHSSSWPDGADMTGKKVAVIGAGATSVQIVEQLSKQADHLTMFMRRPSYCLPMHNRAITKDEEKSLKPYFPGLFQLGRKSQSGIPMQGPPLSIFQVSDAEREAHFETLWETGGFNYAARSYMDVLVDLKANRVVYDFWAKKVRQRFSDPVKRDLMAPPEPPYPILTKRPPLEQDYYDMLDRKNVEIADLNAVPIKSFTERGILMEDGKEHEFDAIVLATGFDSFTGSLTSMGLKNKDGIDIKDVWKDGVNSYLGMHIKGFPNAFMIYSPQAPTALSNGPTILECQCDYVAEVIAKMEKEGFKSIEPEEAAQQEWNHIIVSVSQMTLLPLTSSWWTGGNIPGKKEQLLTFVGGIGLYEDMCRGKLDGWKGFAVTAV